MVSTILQRVIWRDGFPGPICARAYTLAPYFDDWAEFVEGIDGVWPRPDHCRTAFEKMTGRGDDWQRNLE